MGTKSITCLLQTIHEGPRLLELGCIFVTYKIGNHLLGQKSPQNGLRLSGFNELRFKRINLRVQCYHYTSGFEYVHEQADTRHSSYEPPSVTSSPQL